MATHSFRSEIRKQVWFKGFIILSILLFGISYIGLIEDQGKAQEQLFKAMERMPVWLSFVMVAVVAPILEESIFRFGIRYKRNVFYGYVVSMLVIAVLGSKSWMVTCFLLLFAGFIVFRKIKSQAYINMLVIFSSLAFALAHLSNSGDISMLTSIFYIAQLFSIGLLLMLIRLRWGLIYSILTHSVWNFVGVLLMFLVFPKTIEYQSDNLNISLERDAIFANKSIQMMNSKNDTMQFEHYSLSQITESLFDEQKLSYIDEAVSMNFVTYSGYIVEDNLSLESMSQAFGYKIDTVSSTISHYVISDTIVEGGYMSFSDLYPKIDSVLAARNDCYRLMLKGSSVGGIIKRFAQENQVQVHLNLPDSILDVRVDSFGYNGFYDFVQVVGLLSHQLEQDWYHGYYQEEGETYVLTPKN